MNGCCLLNDVIELASIAVTPEAERETLQRIPVEIDERIPVEVDTVIISIRRGDFPTAGAVGRYASPS
jgi:hypothetical protein